MTQLSGNVYVAARTRIEPSKNLVQLPIKAQVNCDHTFSVCASRDCIECWELDWELLFARTGGGRILYEAVYIEPAPADTAHHGRPSIEMVV